MALDGARELKLVQYLNEAYGKEKELETSLQAHIAMTTRASYKKRLQQHLAETKRHGREVERRIKKIGGDVELLPGPVPSAVTEAATTVQAVAGRAVAAAKGPMHALRGTGEQEKLLKNAKTEYSEEAEEIATYTAIEVLADTVGDRETAQLARSIRREEERMAKFLERLIPQLTKAVAVEEIPASERRTATRRRRRKTGARASSRSRAKSSASRARSSSSRAKGRGSRAKSGGSRASASRSRSSGSRSRSRGGSSGRRR
jgi:ferritin-like metal-binding protein YciE